MKTIYRNYIKRMIDIVLSVVGILLLVVPMLIIAVIIKLDSPGPVFFKQKRVGLHKTHFYIMKFRSMSTKAPAEMPTHMLSNPEAYLTKWQKFIRKSSIDELPQLFNILLGTMSVIGPRPALWNQYDLIEERDRYGANDVRPGLTGWAQINGRDELSVEVKAHYDGEYVQKMGFIFDCRCFFATIGKVLKREDVVEGTTKKEHMEK